MRIRSREGRGGEGDEVRAASTSRRPRVRDPGFRGWDGGWGDGGMEGWRVRSVFPGAVLEFYAIIKAWESGTPFHE